MPYPTSSNIGTRTTHHELPRPYDLLQQRKLVKTAPFPHKHPILNFLVGNAHEEGRLAAWLSIPARAIVGALDVPAGGYSPFLHITQPTNMVDGQRQIGEGRHAGHDPGHVVATTVEFAVGWHKGHVVGRVVVLNLVEEPPVPNLVEGAAYEAFYVVYIALTALFR